MSRYTDADALLNRLNELSIEYRADINSEITKAPSIDIVRCRECKYYNDDYTGEWCGRFRDPHPCRADGFCSYGSRSEKPNNSTTEDSSNVGKE